MTHSNRTNTERGTAEAVAVRQIEEMERDDLLRVWVETFGQAVPRGLSQPMLRRFLAFEWQAARLGGLPRAVRQRLEKGPAQARPPRQTPGLKPGGRLLREWNGTTHVVEVVEDGFLWNGDRHRSLTAIARAITGAHWSGPRFFGLTGAARG